MPRKIVLDLSSFKKTTTSLDEASIEYQKNPDNTFVLDAIIHRFKCAYDLSCKILKRYLELSEPNAEEIDQMAFPNLIRTGSERGLLLNGWDIWNVYRTARNITSHTYDEKKAIQVCSVTPQFLQEAKHLLAKLLEHTVQQC